MLKTVKYKILQVLLNPIKLPLNENGLPNSGQPVKTSDVNGFWQRNV